MLLGFVAEIPHEVDRPRQLVQLGTVRCVLDSVAEGLYHAGIISIGLTRCKTNLDTVVTLFF